MPLTSRVMPGRCKGETLSPGKRTSFDAYVPSESGRGRSLRDCFPGRQSNTRGCRSTRTCGFDCPIELQRTIATSMRRSTSSGTGLPLA